MIKALNSSYKELLGTAKENTTVDANMINFFMLRTGEIHETANLVGTTRTARNAMVLGIAMILGITRIH